MEGEISEQDFTIRQLRALVRKCGGPEAVQRLMRDELRIVEPDQPWTEVDGVIYITVTSDGTTGEQWIAWLEAEKIALSNDVQHLLRSSEFAPTTDVITEIAVLKGMLFEDRDRKFGKIVAEAKRRKHVHPSPEVACLILKKFTAQHFRGMGLHCVIVMHKPINDCRSKPCMLGISYVEDERKIVVFDDYPNHDCLRGHSFAFEIKTI